MKTVLLALSLCGLFMTSSWNVSAQNKDKRIEKREAREARVKADDLKIAQSNTANIESLNFSFYPSAYEPEFGIQQELTGMADFYFTVDKSSFYMNLPYVGRFYANPMNMEGVPVSMTSKEFLYSIRSTDNINYVVTILPNDLGSYFNQGTKFVFYMNKNSSYARLVVSAEDRQDMTYYGSFK